MAGLPDHEIRRRINDGDLVIRPLNLDTQLQPASVDLRLGDNYRWLGDMKEQTAKNGQIEFAPGETYLATTIETVAIPRDLKATLWGRSSVARLGLEIHIAGFIDPGFQGQITLEVTNESPTPTTVDVGSRICQLSFDRLSAPVETSYKEKDDAKYVDQEGATPSRFDQE